MLSVCVLSFCANLVSINHSSYKLELKYEALVYKSNETAHKYESLDNALEYKAKIAVELAMHSVVSNAAHQASKFATTLVEKAKSEGKNVGNCSEIFEESVKTSVTDSLDLLEPCLTKIDEKYRDLSNHLRTGKLNGHELASIVHGIPRACSTFNAEGEYECFKNQLQIYSEKLYYLAARYRQHEKKYEETVSIADEALLCINDNAKDINSMVDESVAVIAECLQSQ